MKKIILSILALSIFLPLFCCASALEYYPLDIKVKALLKYPTPESEAAFVFPIDVSLTGISKDKKWYRFRVAYDLVFLGKYDFEGWAQVDPFTPFTTDATPETVNIP